MFIRTKKISSGFTLIELLVVIAIIGILIATGSASYQRATRLSRDSKRKTDLEQIRQALETYRSENNAYPTQSGWSSTLESGYISSIPDDPKGGDYLYLPSGSPLVSYALCAYLENDPGTSVPTCGSQDCGAGGQNCNYEVENP